LNPTATPWQMTKSSKQGKRGKSGEKERRLKSALGGYTAKDRERNQQKKKKKWGD